MEGNELATIVGGCLWCTVTKAHDQLFQRGTKKTCSFVQSFSPQADLSKPVYSPQTQAQIAALTAGGASEPFALFLGVWKNFQKVTHA